MGALRVPCGLLHACSCSCHCRPWWLPSHCHHHCALVAQVAASCIERGRVVDKLRLRYAELLNAVALSNSGVASRLSTAAAEAAWAGGLVEQQSKELQMLRSEAWKSKLVLVFNGQRLH